MSKTQSRVKHPDNLIPLRRVDEELQTNSLFSVVPAPQEAAAALLMYKLYERKLKQDLVVELSKCDDDGVKYQT